MKKTKVEKHFDLIAENYDRGKVKYKLYYSTLKKILSNYIPKNSSVCEIGCGTGDLLVSLKPGKGFGMDISSEMVAIAAKKHKKFKRIRFSTSYPKEKYNYVFMCDVIEHLEDPSYTFNMIAGLMNKKSVFVNTMANPLWEPLLMVWEKLGLKMKEGPHKRISFREIEMLMNNSGLRVIKHSYELLMPINVPLITPFVNRYIEPILRRLCFVEYIVGIKV